MSNLISETINVVDNFYKGGIGLRSTKLKNYTSGDADKRGMEKIVEELIWMVVDDLGINRSRVQISQDYFNPEDPELEDPQRMYFHVKVDDKYPLIIESRAWIDKPFYTLKRAVTRNMMELPYVRNKLTDDVKFVYVALALDVKQRLVSTMDRTMGYGDRVHTFKFSPKRRSNKWNYFENGVNEDGVKSFIGLVRNSLQKYAV